MCLFIIRDHYTPSWDVPFDKSVVTAAAWEFFESNKMVWDANRGPNKDDLGHFISGEEVDLFGELPTGKRRMPSAPDIYDGVNASALTPSTPKRGKRRKKENTVNAEYYYV